MFHWFGVVTNTRGDALPGWQVGLVEVGTETVVPIFSDENSTPIINVSGVANRAVADDNGNYDFFVPSGTYTLQFYNPSGVFQRQQRFVAMFGADAANTANLASNAAGKGASLVATEGSGTVQTALNARPTSAALAASGGAALVGVIQSGTGATARTVQDKLRDIVSRSDFDTLANAWAAAGFKPLLDPTSGAVFFTADSAPLDYTTSRARFVFQRRDTGDGATNELIPSAVFQFNYTGNGTVNSGIELSQTIWQGLFGFARKTGDGSGHNFTAIGELGATGPGGYNELGMFQGEATNTGSALGTISGVEMLIKDSPDSGTTTFSTKMQAVVGRIAKYNPTVRKSHNFFASSEGSQPPDAVLGVNPSGLASWQRGFDFQGATFTTGQFGLAPNNTFLAWLRAGGSASPVIGVNNSDAVFLAATNSTGVVNITDSAFATRLQVDNNATDAVLIWVGGVLKRVTEGASDSGGTGFRMLRVAN